MLTTKSGWQHSRMLPLCLLVSVLCVAGCSGPSDATKTPSGDAADLAVLQRQLQDLQQRAAQVKDANAIKKLQRAYGYYVEKGLWDEVVNLFADDASLELARDGVYQGKHSIRKYFLALGQGKQGLHAGQLNEQLQVMPVVTLGTDGKTAKARWRNILLVGELGKHAEWGEGPFENEYVKDKGVWKFSKMKWQQAILVSYDGGWAKHEDYNKGIWVSDKVSPDAPPTQDHGSWPQTWLLPFHFSNPVATYVPPAAAAAEGQTKPGGQP